MKFKLNQIAEWRLSATKNCFKFDQFESQFSRFDSELSLTKALIQSKFDSYNDNLTLAVENGLKSAQAQLLKEIKKHLIELILNLRENKVSSSYILKFVANKLTPNVFGHIFDLILKADSLFFKLKYFNMSHAILSTSYAAKPRVSHLCDITNSQGFFKCTKLILDENTVFFLIEYQKRRCVLQLRSVKRDLILVSTPTIYLGPL